MRKKIDQSVVVAQEIIKKDGRGIFAKKTIKIKTKVKCAYEVWNQQC